MWHPEKVKHVIEDCNLHSSSWSKLDRIRLNDKQFTLQLMSTIPTTGQFKHPDSLWQLNETSVIIYFHIYQWLILTPQWGRTDLRKYSKRLVCNIWCDRIVKWAITWKYNLRNLFHGDEANFMCSLLAFRVILNFIFEDPFSFPIFFIPLSCNTLRYLGVLWTGT